MEFLEKILTVGRKQILFTQHALDQMNKPERLITPEEVKEVVFNGKIIENYPEDSRGHSCLMAGSTFKKRYAHVVCAPKEEYLAVITAYLPNIEEWEKDFGKRKDQK